MIRNYKHLIKLKHLYGINAFNVCESEMMMVRSIMLEFYTDCPFYEEIIEQKVSFSEKKKKNSLKKYLC